MTILLKVHDSSILIDVSTNSGIRGWNTIYLRGTEQQLTLGMRRVIYSKTLNSDSKPSQND